MPEEQEKEEEEVADLRCLRREERSIVRRRPATNAHGLFRFLYWVVRDGLLSPWARSFGEQEQQRERKESVRGDWFPSRYYFCWCAAATTATTTTTTPGNGLSLLRRNRAGMTLYGAPERARVFHHPPSSASIGAAYCPCCYYFGVVCVLWSDRSSVPIRDDILFGSVVRRTAVGSHGVSDGRY